MNASAPRPLSRLSLCAAFALAPAVIAFAADDLERDFAAPPQAAKPYVWWHWLSGAISPDGVDRDLAAMKEAGLGGAVITNIASLPSIPGNKIANSPWPEIKYANPAWWALMKHAIMDGYAKGLDMGVVNCPGWAVSGGPWITAELSMQRLAWTETKVAGPQHFSGKLPQTKLNPKWNYYRDIAVIAVPDGAVVSLAEIVDLSAQLKPDGAIEWDAPSGKWTLYRFGHTTNGRMTNPLPDGVEALECDKLSARASAFHIEQLLATLRANLGPVIGKELRHVHFDSFEAGAADWTANLPAEFKALRGYDIIPWLPVLAGRQVGDATMTGRFKWDMRETLNQMFVRNNLGTMARLLKDAGIRMSLEPYTGPFDTIAATAQCELPMSEFWSQPKSWLNTRPDRHDEITRNVTASAQDLDAKIVCAEALTGFPMDSRWTEDPACLKPAIDWAMVSGINQFQLHSWVLQPFGDDVKPGMTLSWWGTHFGRNQTWAKQGKEFFSYLSRCSAILQHGSVVSDFCSVGFVGSEGDAISFDQFLTTKFVNGRVMAPSGHTYAVLALPADTRAMLPAVAAKVKELVGAGAAILAPKPTASPSLAGYPESDRAVAAIGGEVWGAMDGVSVTQNNFGRGTVYWGVAAQTVLAARNVAADFIAEAAVPTNLRALHRREGEADIYFVVNSATEAVDSILSFRITGKTPELWYPASGSIVNPALWGAAGDRTRLPLRVGPMETVFVIFRHPATTDPVRAVTRSEIFSPERETIGLHYLAEGSYVAQSVALAGAALDSGMLSTTSDCQLRLRTGRTGRYEFTLASGRHLGVDVNKLPEPLELSGAWKVSFAPGMGAPASMTFIGLSSWTDSADIGVKYFSGTATYEKELPLTAVQPRPHQRIMLDLGAVKSLAQVKVNGRDFGVLWTPPFAVDITDAVNVGANTLEIAVTNTWRNRLIGDEQQPADVAWGDFKMFRKVIPGGAPLVRYPDWLATDKARPSPGRHTFVSWNYFNKESSLMESGLLGPVTVRVEADITVSTK